MSSGGICRCDFNIRVKESASYDDSDRVVQVLCESFAPQRTMGLLAVTYGGMQRIIDVAAPMVVRSHNHTATTAEHKRAKAIFRDARAAFLSTRHVPNGQ